MRSNSRSTEREKDEVKLNCGKSDICKVEEETKQQLELKF